MGGGGGEEKNLFGKFSSFGQRDRKKRRRKEKWREEEEEQEQEQGTKVYNRIQFFGAKSKSVE